MTAVWSRYQKLRRSWPTATKRGPRQFVDVDPSFHRVSVSSDEAGDQTVGTHDNGLAPARTLSPLSDWDLYLRYRDLDADHGPGLGDEHPNEQGGHARNGQFRRRLADAFSHHV